jgi:ABC-2 type transport system ATP-binding protein
MDYAIETIDLVKRYPTTARKGVRPGQGGLQARRRVDSLGGLFNTITTRHGTFIEALCGVNLQIKEGEVFGLLGPNGAGKTTLVKILCTLVIHDEGQALVHGFDVKKQPREVLKYLQAILPESRGFDWRLTGRQNLEFYALLYGVNDKEARQRIDYLLDFTGLKERADDGYQRYSTGMQRKLLLCRALLRNTPTLLFDEPTAGLDPVAAAEFRGLLRDRLARGEGKAILLSTHNLDEAEDICDRVAILNSGKILACDTPGNIQHLMFDKTELNICFAGALSGEPQEILLRDIKGIPGVGEVTPDLSRDNGCLGLSVRGDKDMNISSILALIINSGVKIEAVNTTEPSLEDVFMHLTRQSASGREEEERSDT